MEIPGLGGWDDTMAQNSYQEMQNDFYNHRNNDRQVRTGLTLHHEPPPTQEVPSFMQERKKVYTKPVPKDFAKAWEKNKEGEVLQEQKQWPVHQHQ
jgi:hypothetical protein